MIESHGRCRRLLGAVFALLVGLGLAVGLLATAPALASRSVSFKAESALEGEAPIVSALQDYYIRGTVRDFNGAALSDAWVKADPGNVIARTDVRGAFSLTVPAGTYALSAGKYGYPGPPTQTVTVPPSQFNVSFVFPQRYTIRGGVGDYEGTPVQDVWVCADPEGFCTLTDERGVYTLTVSAGTYTLSAAKDGYPSPPTQTVTVPPSRINIFFVFPRRFTIRGIVLDYERHAVSNAWVSAGRGSNGCWSDARGAYTLTVVTGTYNVQASKAGYFSPPPRSVSVPPNQTGIDFVFLQSYTIEGHVRDYDGSELEDALVNTSPSASIAWTDATGFYTLRVPGGTYSLTVSKGGYPAPLPQVVTVPPGRARVDFTFPRRYTVQGRVRDYDQRPMTDVWLSAFPDGYGALTDPLGLYTLTVTTGTFSISASKPGYPGPPVQVISVPPDRQGVDFTFPERYTISGTVRYSNGVPAENVLVTTSPGGYSAWSDSDGMYALTVTAGTYSVGVYKEGYISPAEQTVNVPPSRSNVDFAFPTCYTIRGRVSDASGKSVPDAQVTASPGNHSTWTDSGGVYTLTVIAGTYDVSVSKGGYTSPPARTVSVPPDRYDVDLSFLRDYIMGGRVRDYDMTPVPDAWVAASPGGYATSTDANGVYTLAVVSGVYAVSASKYGYPILPSRAVTVPPDHTDVDFTFPQCYTIGGTVREHNGTPVQDVVVTTSPGDYLTFTDANGVYTLTVVSGTYTVSAFKFGYPGPLTQTVTVPPSRTDVNFTFPQRYTIAGRASEQDGTPVPDVWITASPGNYTTFTDASGVYTMTVVSGSYTVTASKFGYPGPLTCTVTVPPSRTDVNFIFTGIYTIGGVVREQRGTPVPDVMVSASPGGYAAFTDAGGVYTLTVVSGTYVVSAFKYGYPSTLTQTVTVPPSRNDVNFTFPQRYVIGGAVRDEEHNPLQGVQVTAAPGDYTTFTDVSGVYTLTVVSGTYALSAFRYGYENPPTQTVTVPPDRTNADFVLVRVSTPTPTITATPTMTPTPTATSTTTPTPTPTSVIYYKVCLPIVFKK